MARALISLEALLILARILMFRSGSLTYRKGIEKHPGECQKAELSGLGRRTLTQRISGARLALTAIIIVAAVLRLLYLGKESLWFDESASVAIAKLDWAGLWRVVSRSEANMGLYYGLLHVWINLGDSEFVIRCMSAFAGALTVPVVYLLGKRMFGTKVAFISAALLSVNSFHIKYSQEARGYSLVVLLAVVSSLFFVRAIEHRSRNDWAGYVLTSALAVYSHFFGVLVLAAQWASVAFLQPREVPWRRLLLSILMICILLLPLAFFAFTRDTGQLAWVSKTSIYDVYDLFNSLAGGRLLAVAYFVFCSIALLPVLRAWVHSRASFDTWRYGFVLSWLFVPISSSFAISLVKPIFVDRFLIICLPALVLLAAIGVSQIRQQWLLAGSLVVLLVLSARRIPWNKAQLEKEDWRGATTYVVSHASSNDGILFYTSYGRFGFDYYARRLRPRSQTVRIVFPDRSDFNPARADPDDSLLASLPQQYKQIWLVVRFNELDPVLMQRDRSIESILASEYPNAIEKKFTGMWVLRYSRGERVDP
jgi:mannosyltransferase